TAEEIEEFRRRWSPYLQGDDVLLVKPFDTFAGQTEDRGRSRNGDSSTFYEFVPCEFLWRNLAIFWDGRVTSCCFDVDGRLTVGNLEGTSLTEIWLGQLLQNLRWVHERGLFERLPLCGQCSKTKEFGPDARMRAEDWPGSTEVIRVGDPPSDNLFGAGWYPVDQTDPPVRWTKRKASVFLKLPSSADAIQVLCSSGFPCIDGTPTALKLLIDDEVRGQFALSDNNWHVLQCRLSGRERTEVVKLDIVVAETWCPHTVTGSGDMRELGIAVREIRVR
ncbi:MAG: SPASM domain-containing protein, partial [Chloroflexi bacterium]|nr:SPASM domain-containing protein [Chloroflexota bacterium]